MSRQAHTHCARATKPTGVHVVVAGAGTLNIEAGLERYDERGYRLTGHRVSGATPELCAALSA